MARWRRPGDSKTGGCLKYWTKAGGSLTMMPGDSQSKMVAIASDATVGNCQNCSVLHQILNEYVSSFVALKQKITASDDAIKLQQQLEELQAILVTLQKKTEDYEHVQAELEEKKLTLKVYGQMSEKMDILKQENSNTTAESKKLKDQLKDTKDLMETQSLENAKLKREKAVVENDLLETQTSLIKAQAQADRVEKLIEEKAKITSIKDKLENKVKLLKDLVCKQNHQISQLTKDNILIASNVDDLQMRLMTLERERIKEYRSTSTQATLPQEPKVDKEKFRMLLADLLACVDPQQQHSANLFHVPESCSSHVPPSPQNRQHSCPCHTSPSSHKISEYNNCPMQTETTIQLKFSPHRQKAVKHQSGLQSACVKKQTESPRKYKRLSKQHKPEESFTNAGSLQVSVEDIMAMFKPMLPCISPLPELVKIQGKEIEFMETDVGEMGDHHRPSVHDQLQNLSLITTSVLSHSPKSSEALTESKEDLPVVKPQEVEEIPCGDSKDLVENEPSDITENNDKSITVGEMYFARDKRPEQGLETLKLMATSSLSSSSTSDATVLVEIVSLTGQEPSCRANSRSGANSISETEYTLPMAKEHLPETNMYVDTSPNDFTEAKTVSSDGAQSHRRIGTTVTSEEAGKAQPLTSSVTSSVFDDSLRGDDPKEDVPETVTKMDIDTSPSDFTGAKTVNPDHAESARRKDKNAASEEAGNVHPLSYTVTFSEFNDSVRGGGPKEDPPGSIRKMEGETSRSDFTGAKTFTSDDAQSPRRKNTTLTSEEAGNLKLLTSSNTSLMPIDSVRDSEAVIGSQIGNGQQNSSGVKPASQDSTFLEPQEKEGYRGVESDVPKGDTCLYRSTDGTSSVSAENVKEMPEIVVQIKHPLKEDKKYVKGTEVADVASSPSELHCDNRPLSSPKSPLLKVEGDTAHVDHESGHANDETPFKKNVDVETFNSEIQAEHGPSLSDAQDTNADYCESLKENTNSLCRVLSPSHLCPTLKSLCSKTFPSPEKMNIFVNTEHISTSKIIQLPVPSLEEESVIHKDLSEDRSDSSNHEVNKYKSGAISPFNSLKQRSVAKNSKTKCLESCTNMLRKQSPHLIREEEPILLAGSATAQPPQCIGQVLNEMGPPLPPVLTPLSTPPKTGKSINPRHAIGKLMFPSPMERLYSPSTPIHANLTSDSQHLSSSCLNSPLRQSGVPSSPLQFGSATPKHAVPVPGRLPVTAMNNSSPSSSSIPSHNENSMRILDSMYPELSAHARTLSILRGNFSLSMCSSESGSSPSGTIGPMSGFKTINSTSTAFTKTESRGGKRQANGLPQPKNSKYLRMDSCSPTVGHKQVPSSSINCGEEAPSPQTVTLKQLRNEATSPSTERGELAEEKRIVYYLEKIEVQCFDLLPVIQSHLFVGNLPKKPVLRDEEKDIISEICQSSALMAEEMIVAILYKLKTEKRNLSSNYMQALCRVHTGICRQRRDWEKAHILAYSILTEDFPDAAKLILFMVTTWPNALSHHSGLCQAIHAVTKLKAQEDLLSCLSAFLGWDKNPPCKVDNLISRTLSDIQSGSKLYFTKHSWYGEDLGTEAWEHIFTLHLICAHKKWRWTYENLLGKHLWPLMNTWMTQPRDQQAPVSDVTVATVLRLIGRLGQLGIKEQCVSSVSTVANVINTFGKYGQTEGVPWDVQLAAIYCIYDLSPCDPKQALDALAGWRGETIMSVPPAVTSCLNQLASVCRQVKS